MSSINFLKCFVKSDVSESIKKTVRKEVCRDLDVQYQKDGNHYCILHLPDNFKGPSSNLNEVIQQRLTENRNHFAYVYFDQINLKKHTFNTEADFSNAFFSAPAFFNDAIFLDKASFALASFVVGVHFNKAVFQEDADFDHASFNENTYFEGVEFQKEQRFSSSVFFRGASFFNTSFVGQSNFINAHFKEYARFDRCKFSDDAVFSESIFEIQPSFRGTEFSWGADFSNSSQPEEETVPGEKKCYVHLVADGMPREVVREAVCNGLEANYIFDDKYFCALHLPDKKKYARSDLDFDKIFSDRLAAGQTDFTHVYFSNSLDLKKIEFNTDVMFRHAVFRYKAVFDNMKFHRGLNFQNAVFIDKVEFKEIDCFGDTSFARAIFSSTCRVVFKNCEFHRPLEFVEAKLEGAISFSGDKEHSVFTSQRTGLDFESARIENPERISFSSLVLHPRWFVNTNPRAFNFSNITWKNLSAGMPSTWWKNISTMWFEIDKKRRQGLSFPTIIFGPIEENDYRCFWRSTVTQEIEDLKHHTAHSLQLLESACRALAVNAEEDNRYEEAMRFRYMAMDTNRRMRLWRRWLPFTLDWWYWATSGYGERALRALLILLIVWIGFAWLYTSPPIMSGLFSESERYNTVDFVNELPTQRENSKNTQTEQEPSQSTNRELGFDEALAYSLGVMTLQRPEPKPASIWALWLVRLETVLGPIQAALLLLAVRRKFMR